MAFDPLLRLKRAFPGEHLDDESEGMTALWERDKPLERPSPVPARDEGELRTTKVRMVTRLAQAKPNAPLLIRLVRHPYALPTGRGKRVSYRGEDAAEQGKTRVDWHAEVRAALADRERVRSTSAVEDRPLPFTIRPSQWTLLPPSGERSGGGT